MCLLPTFLGWVGGTKGEEMNRLLGGILGLIGVFWMFLVGGYAVWWYDRRPANVPPPIALHVLWWNKSVGLPPSLLAQDQAAVQTYQSALSRATARARLQDASYAALSASTQIAALASQKKIHDQGSALRRQIPNVVTPYIDRTMPLSVGLVRVQDAAATGTDLSLVPAPTGLSDDSPSPTTESQLGDLISRNYEECRADQDRLTKLQDWATSVVSISRVGVQSVQ